MFYSPQLLISRKGGFALIWLASTTGVKGSIRKLSRKELLSCNLVKACQQVVTPEEPLALRLSSNLLSGIARVYQQQFLIFASDVVQVQKALEKALSAALSSDSGVAANIDIAPPSTAHLTAKPGTDKAVVPSSLTLTKDPTLALYGCDPDDEVDDRIWYLPGSREEQEAQEAMKEFEIEGSFFSEFEGTPEIAGPGERQPTGAYQAREADITLAEPHIQDYMLEGIGAGEDFGAGEKLELGIFGEGERGLLEGATPELDAALAASSAAARSHAGPSTSAGGAEYQYDDFYAGQDFGGDLGGMEPGDHGTFDYGAAAGPFEGESFEARVAREHAEGIAAREEGLRGAHMVSSPGHPVVEGAIPSEREESSTPSSGTRKRVSTALEEVQNVKQAAKRQKKLKRIPIDKSTEVSSDAFRTMRSSYSERMAIERAKMDKIAQDKEAHQRAMDLIYGPPPMFQGPALSEFWKTVVGSQLTPFDGGKAVEEKKKHGKRSPSKKPSSPAEIARSPLGPEVGRRVSPAGRPSEEVDMGGFDGHDFGGQGDFFEQRDFGGDLGGMGEQPYFPEDVEVGRAASPSGVLASQRQSMVPWAGELATSEAGLPFPGGFGAASSQGGTRISLDQPLGPSMRRSRTPSVAPSATGRGLLEIAQEEGQDLGVFEEGRLSRASSVISPHPSDLASLEAEAQKFLLYAHRQYALLPSPPPSPSSFGRLTSPVKKPKRLRFSDLVPVEDTSASTAAQALYHTLSLAMKGLVKVKQEEAFGEIEINLVGVEAGGAGGA